MPKKAASVQCIQPYYSTYGVRNLEKTICFSLKSWPSERFHRPEMSQIKAEMSLHTNVKLNFHKNVGCQWYQWIPDFYNIKFWGNFYEKINFRLVRTLISALIWDISGLWNRSDGQDFREKRIVFSRFLTPYYVRWQVA